MVKVTPDLYNVYHLEREDQEGRDAFKLNKKKKI